MRWRHGDEVLWRETWRGRTYAEVPTRVVHDDDRQIASGSWRWKDEERMDDWVREGRFTSKDVAAFRAEGERVLAEWPFPTGWEEWQPVPAWAAPKRTQDWRPRG